MRSSLIVLAIVFAGAESLAPVAAQVVKEDVPGITNFKHIESTVACSGAITPEVIPKIKAMGYQSIINLRLPTEQGADIEGHAAVAKSVVLPYYSIPFSALAPDPAVVDQFLKTIQTPGVQPAFIH